MCFDEIKKWWDILKDTFSEIYDAINQLTNDWEASMAELRNVVFYVDDRTMTPRAYGRSLHKTSYICPRYDYIPSFRRSMPYHRRQH